MVTAGVYLRQSIDRSGEGLAVSRQREDCLRLCRDRGWTPVEFVDNDTSASKGIRPAYQRLLEAIRSGAVTAVAVWDLDRLHRQPSELEEFISLADSKHLALATVGGEADLATDGGRLFARIKGAVARSEIERKSARQKRAAQQRAEQGKPWGPRRPFGYASRDGLELHDTEAPLLADAYARVVAGESLASICRGWNERGIRTTQGNAWRSAQLVAILRNIRYAGLRSYQGEIVGATEGPGVVTEDVWRAAESILSDPARRSGPTRGRKYLLSGLALCGRCGAAMGSGTATSTASPIYVCRACHKVSRQVAAVDERVVGTVVARLSRPDALERLTPAAPESDVPALRAEATALRGRLTTLAVDFADGELSAQQLRAATERIRSKLAAVEAEMIDSAQSPILAKLITSEDVSRDFDVLSLDARRAIIDTLAVVTIKPVGRGSVFDPSSVVIAWRSGV